MKHKSKTLTPAGLDIDFDSATLTEKEKQMRNVDVIKHNVNVLKKELNGFIKCIVTCILKFYEIKISPTDIKRDLIVNMITN